MPEVLSNPTFIEQLAQKLRAIGSLKAVGDTWVSFDSSVPPGGVPFCGQEVTRALYADLWTWAQAQGKVKTELEWQEHAMTNGGNCPYYSSGNGSTTFRMPCVLGYFKGSSVTTEGGTYKPQRLPNIKGTGIMYERVAEAAESQFPPKRYQDGADVQPETYQVLVGVYAVGVIQNINNTDVQQLQTGLATLEANAVKSVNGVTPTAGNVNVDIPKNIWGLPTDVFVTPSNPFTAEKNGFFRAFRNGTGAGSIRVNGNDWCSPNNYGYGFVPFKKGDTISTTGLDRLGYFYTE